MNKNQPLTLDDLVQYNNQVLFPALDKKFGKMESSFQELREGQEAILESIANMVATVRQHASKLEDHDQRISRLEQAQVVA